MRRGASACLSALVLALLAASCGSRKEPSEERAEFGIEKSYERGPVSLAVRVSRKEITIAERITLVLDVSAEETYEVGFPKIIEAFEKPGGFSVVDYHHPPPTLGEGGRVLTRRSYELEPFLSGDYEIPPLTLTFWEKGEGEPEEKHELKTEALAVKVNSILPEEQAELTIREIAGPVELPRPSRRWLVPTVAGSVAGLLAVGGLVLWLWRRKRGEAEAPAIPAHELAYGRLEALLAEDLLAKGEVKRFHIRLSAILRHYIEDRFGLHAPERTTEEFLDELRSSEALAAEFRPLLQAFLTHCDLVKFAEHEPTNAEIQGAFDACKEFIEATKATKAPEAPVAAPTAA